MRCLFCRPIWSNLRRRRSLFASIALLVRPPADFNGSMDGVCVRVKAELKMKTRDNVMMNVQIFSASHFETQNLSPPKFLRMQRVRERKTEKQERGRALYECFWQFNSTFWQVLHNRSEHARKHANTTCNNMSTQFNHFVNEIRIIRVRDAPPLECWDFVLPPFRAINRKTKLKFAGILSWRLNRLQEEDKKICHDSRQKMRLRAAHTHT